MARLPILWRRWGTSRHGSPSSGAGGALRGAGTPPLAQVGALRGAGGGHVWRRCDFGWGTCAAKRGSVRCGGAGLAPVSTPAPNTIDTCASNTRDLRQRNQTLDTCANTHRHLRQQYAIPAPIPTDTYASNTRDLRQRNMTPALEELFLRRCRGLLRRNGGSSGKKMKSCGFLPTFV